MAKSNPDNVAAEKDAAILTTIAAEPAVVEVPEQAGVAIIPVDVRVRRAPADVYGPDPDKPDVDQVLRIAQGQIVAVDITYVEKADPEKRRTERTTDGTEGLALLAKMGVSIT